MSDDTDFDVDRLAALSETITEHLTALKRAIVDPDGEHDLLEVAENLWEVLDEVEDVLETIDFGELPDAIDVEDLPEAIEADDIPQGLLDDDETAIELTHVTEAVNLRELWEAVDLTRLRKEKQELDAEVDELKEDVSGEDESDEVLSEDDEDDELIENDIIGMGEETGARVKSSLREEAIEEAIEEGVEAFRKALLATHEKLRKLYKLNQEKLGQPGRQPDSLNPTAYSTMSPGPVPDSASTRVSTVPARVRHSRRTTPRRIYGRRFSEATNGDDTDGDGGDR